MANNDLRFMSRALKLAKQGAGRVHPNPLVGAVLVKNNRIIGKGAHERFGGPHAEVNAIARSKANPAGATLYVTLEPCAHFGKTPPCADFILKNKIKRVVVASKDPNPLVAGRGLRLLKTKGVRVTLGVLEKEARELNRDYNYWMRKKMPYVIVKTAQSLDGKIATKTGESRWITDKAARRMGHALRAESDAVLVGINTVLKDDPFLRRARIKIVLDSRLRTPFSARIFSKQHGGKVILAATKKAPKRRRSLFKGKAEVLLVREKAGRVDLRELLRKLGRRGVVRVMIEGGGELVGSAFSERLVNEFYFFMAPLIIGGKNAIDSVGGTGHAFLKKAISPKNVEIKRVGKDLLVHGML